MIKTLQFKLRNPPRTFLEEGAREVNDVWNWANEVSSKTIRKFSGKAEFLSAFDFNHLTTTASNPCFKKTDSTVELEKLTFPQREKKRESLGFNIIDSGTVQRITTEYVIRRKQFHKWKLRWRASKGSKKSLGWIPFKAESLKLSLQDSTGVFRRLTGRKLDLGQVLKEYDFGTIGRDLESKPKFSLTVLGHHLSFFNTGYLAYYLRTLKAEIKGGNLAQDSLGDWYLNLSVKVEAEVYRTEYLHKVRHYPEVGPVEVVGIDLNSEKDYFIALSTGQILKAGGFYRKAEKKLASLQRNGHVKQTKRLARKVKNQRRDRGQKQTTYLAQIAEIMKVGALHSSRLIKKRKRKKPEQQQQKRQTTKQRGQPKAKTKQKNFSLHLSKSLQDNAPGAFTTQLLDKCHWAGKRAFEVKEAHTTVACSNCYQLTGPRGLKGLSVREWTCSGCGTHHNRHVNSGKNIARIPDEDTSLIKLLRPGTPYRRALPSLGRVVDSAPSKALSACRLPLAGMCGDC